MEKYFKTVQGQYVNIINHTIEQLNKWKDLKIYIGTDSQSYGGDVRYATVIVYRYGTRGAHYIVSKSELARPRDEFQRLYQEGIRTLETAQFFYDELGIYPTLEFDYADVKETISSSLVGVFKGYTNAIFKSSQMMATRAANHECRCGANMFNLQVALLEAA